MMQNMQRPQALGGENNTGFGHEKITMRNSGTNQSIIITIKNRKTNNGSSK